MLNRSWFLSVAALIVLSIHSLPLASASEKENRPNKARTEVKPSPSTTATKTETAPVQVTFPPTVSPLEVSPTPNPVISDPNIIMPLSSPAAGEQIKWQVIAGGGLQGASASYKLGSTIGQTASGPGASASYKLNAGFWQNFSSGCCVKEGDNNHNGTVNVVDVTFLVARLFQGGPAPLCQDESDVTDNGSVNVVDLTTLVAFLFSGGSVGVCP